MDYQDTLIAGVKLKQLKKIPDERGAILHGSKTKELLNDLGEVYFSRIYQGVIKGWHVHKTLQLNYICVQGMIKLVLYDLRSESPTHKITQEFFIGEDNYCLVHIPPGIANASRGLTAPYALVCNLASEPHDPAKKYLRIDPHSREIPYDWDRRDF